MASELVTIVGFGSLLSKRSALLTTPSIQGYQYVRVKGYQRQFAHPAPIFFERNQVAQKGEIPKDEWEPLAKREEEFEFIEAAFEPLEDGAPSLGPNVGLMCTRSTDEKLQQASIWERYEKSLKPAYGEVKVWSWGPDSGIRPCPVYCRHCVLATQKEGVPDYVAKSFLDETFLVDGKTTLRSYLAENLHVMKSEPPEEPPGCSSRDNINRGARSAAGKLRFAKKSEGKRESNAALRC
eukprot:s741_g16.t1